MAEPGPAAPLGMGSQVDTTACRVGPHQPEPVPLPQGEGAGWPGGPPAQGIRHLSGDRDKPRPG